MVSLFGCGGGGGLTTSARCAGGGGGAGLAFLSGATRRGCGAEAFPVTGAAGGGLGAWVCLLCTLVAVLGVSGSRLIAGSLLPATCTSSPLAMGWISSFRPVAASVGSGNGGPWISCLALPHLLPLVELALLPSYPCPAVPTTDGFPWTACVCAGKSDSEKSPKFREPLQASVITGGSGLGSLIQRFF